MRETKQPKREGASLDNRTVVIRATSEEDAGKKFYAKMHGPIITNANALRLVNKQMAGEHINLNSVCEMLEADVASVNRNDMTRVEATLSAQAAVLNALFAELARRAAMNMNGGSEFFQATQTYLNMALKAQSNCRMTLEALANVKNPPVVYARQANITSGPQQVNNNVALPAHTQETINPPSKLVEHSNETPMDNGTAGIAVTAHTPVAAMDPVNRAQVG